MTTYVLAAILLAVSFNQAEASSRVCIVNGSQHPTAFTFSNSVAVHSPSVSPGQIFCFSQDSVPNFTLGPDSVKFRVYAKDAAAGAIAFEARRKEKIPTPVDLYFAFSKLYGTGRFFHSVANQKDATKMVISASTKLAKKYSKQFSKCIFRESCVENDGNPNILPWLCDDSTRREFHTEMFRCALLGLDPTKAATTLMRYALSQSAPEDPSAYISRKITFDCGKRESDFQVLYQNAMGPQTVDTTLSTYNVLKKRYLQQIYEYGWIPSANLCQYIDSKITSVFEYLTDPSYQVNMTRSRVRPDSPQTVLVSNNDKFDTGFYQMGGQDAVYLCYNPAGLQGTCSGPQFYSNQPQLPVGGVGSLALANSTQATARITIAGGKSDKPTNPASYILAPGASIVLEPSTLQPIADSSPSKKISFYVSTKFDAGLNEKRYSDSYFECAMEQPYKPTDAPAAVNFKYSFIADGSDSHEKFSAFPANPFYGPYECKIISQHDNPTYEAIRDSVCPKDSFQTKKPKIIGYYANWSYYKNFLPINIPCEVDEVVYAFAQIGDCAGPESNYASETDPKRCIASNQHAGVQDYKLHATDPYVDFASKEIGGHYGAIAQILSKGKPVLLSIGGWSLSRPLRDAIRPEHRKEFVESIIAFMVTAQYDARTYYSVKQEFAGVDVDWEPNYNNWTLPNAGVPAAQLNKQDLQNYKDFLMELKKALHDAKNKGVIGGDVLKIATSANPLALAHVEETYPGYWKSLADELYSINLMSYDYHGPGFPDDLKVGYTNFNSPLKAGDLQPQNMDPKHRAKFNTHAAVEVLKSFGVAFDKIGIGVATYGRAYVLKTPVDTSKSVNYRPYVTDLYNGRGARQFSSNSQGDTSYLFSQIMTGRYYVMKGDDELGKPMFDEKKLDAEFPASGYYPGNSDHLWQERQSYWIGTHKFEGGTEPIYVDSDDYASACYKMEYASAKEHPLASVMIWDLGGDVAVRRDGDLFWNKSVVRGLQQCRR